MNLDQFSRMEIQIFLVVLFAGSLQAYNFNQASSSSSWNKYPNSCCQLEWEDIYQGQDLPKDYVLAGYYNGYKGAFTVSKLPSTAIKFNGYSSPDWRCKDTAGIPTGPWPILVNPNQCVLGWDKIKYRQAPKPNQGKWFFPNVDYHPSGGFARHGNTPARIDGTGYARPAYSLCWQWYHYDPNTYNIELLYVDCVKSLTKMSNAQLINITYNQEDFNRLLKTEREETILPNNNSYSRTHNFKYSVNRFNNASFKMTNKVKKLSKIEKNSGHNFKISVPKIFSGFLKLLGVEMGVEYDYSNKYQDLFENEESSETEVQTFSSSAQRYRHIEKIKLAPFSKTTINITTSLYKGLVPFKAVYEVTPSGTHTMEMVIAAMKKYRFDHEFSKTKVNTLIVEVAGHVSVDSGYQTVIDIKCDPLPGFQACKSEYSKLKKIKL